MNLIIIIYFYLFVNKIIKFIFAKSLLYLYLFEFIYYIRLIETKLTYLASY